MLPEECRRCGESIRRVVMASTRDPVVVDARPHADGDLMRLTHYAGPDDGRFVHLAGPLLLNARVHKLHLYRLHECDVAI